MGKLFCPFLCQTAGFFGPKGSPLPLPWGLISLLEDSGSAGKRGWVSAQGLSRPAALALYPNPSPRQGPLALLLSVLWPGLSPGDTPHPSGYTLLSYPVPPTSVLQRWRTLSVFHRKNASFWAKLVSTFCKTRTVSIALFREGRPADAQFTILQLKEYWT